MSDGLSSLQQAPDWFFFLLGKNWVVYHISYQALSGCWKGLINHWVLDKTYDKPLIFLFRLLSHFLLSRVLMLKFLFSLPLFFCSLLFIYCGAVPLPFFTLWDHRKCGNFLCPIIPLPSVCWLCVLLHQPTHFQLSLMSQIPLSHSSS